MGMSIVRTVARWSGGKPGAAQAPTTLARGLSDGDVDAALARATGHCDGLPAGAAGDSALIQVHAVKDGEPPVGLAVYERWVAADDQAIAGAAAAKLKPEAPRGS